MTKTVGSIVIIMAAACARTVQGLVSMIGLVKVLTDFQPQGE